MCYTTPYIAEKPQRCLKRAVRIALVLAAVPAVFIRKKSIGSIRAPQVQLLREAGRSMGHGRLCCAAPFDPDTEQIQIQKELIQHWLNS